MKNRRPSLTARAERLDATAAEMEKLVAGEPWHRRRDRLAMAAQYRVQALQLRARANPVVLDDDLPF